MPPERPWFIVTVKPCDPFQLERIVNITAQATVDSTSLADIVSLFHPARDRKQHYGFSQSFRRCDERDLNSTRDSENVGVSAGS